jgi:ribose 5-phosphate isomerase B
MSVSKKIGIAADHAGFELKEELKPYLETLGYEPVDFGTHSLDSVDYPDFVHPLASKIQHGDLENGIIICGSGNGVNMAANKHQGIRSALCWLPEIAQLAKTHNNANMIALPARFISADVAREIVKAYLNAMFEGGRHQRRVEKIDQC